MNRWFALLLLALGLALPVSAQPHPRPALEQEKIDYLIASVATLQDAVFIRNGSEYDAQRAADHLREKLAYADGRVETANDFIDLCATASWLSHRSYTIRFHDGHVMESAVYLRSRLRDFDAERWNRMHPAVDPHKS